MKARNWLTHHFYRQFAPVHVTEADRRRSLVLLRHTRQIFEMAHEVLAEELVKLLNNAGISPDAATASANRALEHFASLEIEPRETWRIVEELEFDESARESTQRSSSA